MTKEQPRAERGVRASLGNPATVFRVSVEGTLMQQWLLAAAQAAAKRRQTDAEVFQRKEGECPTVK